MFLHEDGSSAEEFIGIFLANVTIEVSEEATIFAVMTYINPAMNALGKLLEGGNILNLYCTDHVLHLTCKRCYELQSFGDAEISVAQKATNINKLFTDHKGKLLVVGENGTSHVDILV